MFLAPASKTHKENLCFGLWEPHGGSQGCASWPRNTKSWSENTKNGLNQVAVAPFGVSRGRNGVPGAAEPLGLLPAPKTVIFFFCSPILGLGASGPWGPWDCPISPLKAITPDQPPYGGDMLIRCKGYTGCRMAKTLTPSALDKKTASFNKPLGFSYWN